jgi:isopenicillin N synthase-like dioxygenase
MQHAHSIAVDVVLGVLNRGLGLPEGTLAGLHRLDCASGDQVRLLRAPPLPEEERERLALAAATTTKTNGNGVVTDRPLLGAHTDFGSVTVLFARVGGLQVSLPSLENGNALKSNGVGGAKVLNGDTNVSDNGTWAYVRPLPGHAVVNLGDALVYLSAGVLRSALHRVVTPPGDQAQTTKYSVVYFCRPEDTVPMRPLKESTVIQTRVETGIWNNDVDKENISAKEWILGRALRSRGMKTWKTGIGDVK